MHPPNLDGRTRLPIPPSRLRTRKSELFKCPVCKQEERLLEGSYAKNVFIETHLNLHRLEALAKDMN